MLVAIKKFKESDDNEYVRNWTNRDLYHIIKKFSLFDLIEENLLCYIIGAKNGFKRDKNFEIVETRSYCESYRSV